MCTGGARGLCTCLSAMDKNCFRICRKNRRNMFIKLLTVANSLFFYVRLGNKAKVCM